MSYDKQPANWIVQDNDFHISEKGCVKAFSKDGKLVGMFMPTQLDWIANNSATLVAFINSNRYQQVIVKKGLAKADAKLAFAMQKRLDEIKALEETIAKLKASQL